MSLDLVRAQASLEEALLAIQNLDQEVLAKSARLFAGLQETPRILWAMSNGGSSSTGGLQLNENRERRTAPYHV